MNLCDPWRRKHPNKTEYSCYSSSLKSYSQIDYFLILKKLFHLIFDCSHESFVISDHGPVKLLYNVSKIITGPRRWRLHPRWLHDSKFIEFIDIYIDLFFKTNLKETFASVRWEAFKAYIRGQILRYTCSVNNKIKLELQNLEERIWKLEEDIYSDLSNSSLLKQEMLILGVHYNELSAANLKPV